MQSRGTPSTFRRRLHIRARDASRGQFRQQTLRGSSEANQPPHATQVRSTSTSGSAATSPSDRALRSCAAVIAQSREQYERRSLAFGRKVTPQLWQTQRGRSRERTSHAWQRPPRSTHGLAQSTHGHRRVGTSPQP
jgi:hypothetical protein